MGTEKSLDLEPIITGLCYRKNETLTETQIRQAIAEAIVNFGIEYVTTLPTGSDIKEKIYILPDSSQSTGSLGDIYVYDKTNQKWIHVDGLKFDIGEYTKISDIVDNVTSTNTNKPLSANQGKVLKGLIDGALTPNDVKDNLTSTDTNKPLSANQGKLLDEKISNKVDKVTGKGLSTNDYTTAEKNKLSDIEAEANKTVVVDNLNSTVSTDALSANQGKILKDLADTKANTNHTHTISNISDLTIANSVSDGDPNPVSSNAVYDYIDDIIGDIDTWLTS